MITPAQLVQQIRTALQTQQENQPTDYFVEQLALMIAALPPPGSDSAIIEVPFGFATPSPLLLTAVLPGYTVIESRVVVTTVFDDPGATVVLGDVATPNLILDAADTNVLKAAQYVNSASFPFAVPESLILTIAPGLSTQGAGYVVLVVKE